MQNSTPTELHSLCDRKIIGGDKLRLRHRKKMINRRALADIRLAQLIVELNRTVEEAYRSLSEVLDLVDAPADDEGTQAS